MNNLFSQQEVTRTERGWAGHFIGASRCHFRRNTLLCFGDVKIVISTVGMMEINGKFEPIGIDHHYETMAFHAKENDRVYFDADVKNQIWFNLPTTIEKKGDDNAANKMHEDIVAFFINKLKAGCAFGDDDDW